MAKLLPDGRISGAMGGSVYAPQPDGSVTLRAKGGATRENFLNRPSMARTRENAYDHGRASSTGSLVRKCLHKMIKTHKLADRILSGRFHGISNRILRTDPTGNRGVRQLSRGNVGLLKEFEFFKDPAHAFQAVFDAPVSCSICAGTGRVQLTIPSFDPVKRLRVPGGATHFTVLLNCAAVNFDKRQYEYRDDETGLYTLHEPATTPIKLTHDMPMDAGYFLIATMGIAFYKATANGRMELVEGGVMKILEVQRAEPALEEMNVESRMEQGAMQPTPCDAPGLTGLSRVRGRQCCDACELPALMVGDMKDSCGPVKSRSRKTVKHNEQRARNEHRKQAIAPRRADAEPTPTARAATPAPVWTRHDEKYSADHSLPLLFASADNAAYNITYTMERPNDSMPYWRGPYRDG